MSNLTVDTLTNQDVQLAKAWVNFNGTGTVAIRSAFNVSSITDNGVGLFVANTSLADNDAVASVTANTLTGAQVAKVNSVSTTAIDVTVVNNGAFYDASLVLIIAFGN